MKKPRYKNHRFSSGFTLIELLVTISIISILVVIASVGFRSYQRKTDLDVTTQEVINTLKKAQSMSITAKSASKFGVHFDAAAKKYILFEGDSWATRNLASDEEHVIPKTLEMYDVNFAETGVDVIFTKLNGTTPNFGSLKLKISAAPGNFRRVSVSSEGKIGEYELTEVVPPGSFSLISPPKGYHETSTLTPSFDWQDSSGSGITYTLWHSTDPHFATKTEISGILNSHYTLQPAEALANHQRNYWKVKARNAAGGETWSREQDWYLDVDVSQPPNDFSLLSPVNGYNETSTLTPTFDWEDTTDPDGDPITYTLQHATNTNFNPKTEITLITDSHYTLKESEKLANHTTNYWRVYAVDNHGASKLCREGYWSINTDVNFAPNQFSLISPANNEIVTTLTPTFDWQDATDPDPGDSLTYTLWYSTDPTFASKIEITGLTASTYTVPSSQPLSDGATYYWKVKAIDSHGAETWSREQDWKFQVLTNQPPGEFSLLAPTNGETLNTLNPLFDWQDSSDPNPGDTVTYTLWVDDDPDFSSLLFEKSGLTITQYTAVTSDGLEDGKTYYWKVKAVDNHGAERWSNETDWSFSIDITDWYVDQSRPTSGSGTSWDEAFRTINEAVGKLTSSDTVHIANGTYSEQINLTSSHSGTASDRTVFINKEGDTNVIVDGATYGFYLNNADYVEIHGLKITSSSYGIYLYNNADHNKVTNCEIYGNSVNGVFLHSSNGGYNEIDHNKVYSNPDGGIYSYGDQNNSFYRNQVYANSSYGFYIYNPLSYHVYNNTIYQNGTYGIYFYRNNILYPSKFRNNIIVGHTRGFRGVLASGLDTDYEDVWNNTTNYQGITAGPNSISLDPQFVNPAAYDFHLRPTSPCINRGDPDPFYNDPDGTRADIGALYFPFENPTDWYVDQSMPISGDGRSWATAFKTINEAVRVLDSGDTVHIANGTYHEQINLTSSHSGTAADHTLFINKEGDTNVVVEGSFFGFFFNNADYVDINGLKITDSFYGIYYYNDADHNRITNSEIYNNRFYGVKIHLSNGGYNEIDHNKIHDNRYGIAARSSTNNKFYRNQIYRNDRYGVYLFRPYNYRIYNNTIYENGRFGVFFSTQEDPTRLIQSRNNIVIGHTFGFYGFQVSAGLVTDYEDIWNNDINYRNIVPGPNSIAQDPLFINPGAYDFHLRPTSPCIDRGDPDPFYNDPDGTRADIGALWYGAP